MRRNLGRNASATTRPSRSRKKGSRVVFSGPRFGRRPAAKLHPVRPPRLSGLTVAVLAAEGVTGAVKWLMPKKSAGSRDDSRKIVFGGTGGRASRLAHPVRVIPRSRIRGSAKTSKFEPGCVPRRSQNFLVLSTVARRPGQRALVMLARMPESGERHRAHGAPETREP